jgi:hypothetical protein
MYNIQYIIYTVYNIQYTVHNIQYTIHNIQYTIYRVIEKSQSQSLKHVFVKRKEVH